MPHHPDQAASPPTEDADAPTSTAALIEQVMPLAEEYDRRLLQRLRERADQGRLRVLVAGEAKRGKSTVVNALLGTPVLPTGVTPVTAVTTTVRAAAPEERERVMLTFLDGRSLTAPVAELGRWVTESANADNTLGVADADVLLHQDMLSRYAVELVDIPGTGSVYAHNTAEAHAALATLDAAVLVLSADPPVSAAEADLLRAISDRSVRTFVLLNKSDRLPDHAELAQALGFTEQVCAGVTGAPVTVTACCARAGMADPGFARFASDLTSYLHTFGHRDAERAQRAHVARLLTVLLDQVRVRLRLLDLADEGQTHAIQELGDRLVAVTTRSRAVADTMAGALRRLRAELDASARTELPVLVEDCRAGFDEAWVGRLGAVPTAQLADQARAVVTAHLGGSVERWRQGQATGLREGLAAVSRRVLEDLAEEQRLAAEAVRDLLDLSISSHPLDPQLLDHDRFSDEFTQPQSWAPPLAGTLARLAGGTRRRQRIRQSLTAQIPAVADQQLGRARADLQTRLQDAGRALTVDLQDQAAATLGRLHAAVSDLTARPTGTDSTPERVALQRRAKQLQSLLGRADAVGEDAGRTPGDTERTAGRGAVQDRAAQLAPPGHEEG